MKGFFLTVLALGVASCQPRPPLPEAPGQSHAPTTAPPSAPPGETPPGPAPDDSDLHGPEPGLDGEGAPTEAPAEPPDVEIESPELTTGEIKSLDDKLASNREAIAQCVADHGGLEGDRGTLKIQFLVQAAGKAEGVDIIKHEGISDEAAKCVKTHLHKRNIGTPSVEPIGVTVVIKLSRA